MTKVPSVQEQVAKWKKKLPLPTQAGAWEQMRDDPEFFDTLMEFICSGKPVAEFARAVEIDPGKINHWMNSQKGERATLIEEARMARAGVFADRILEVMEKVSTGEYTPRQGKVIADQFMRLAAQMDPHLWGKRIQVYQKTEVEMHLEAVRELAVKVKRGEDGFVIEGQVEPKMQPKPQLIGPDPQMGEDDVKLREELLS